MTARKSVIKKVKDTHEVSEMMLNWFGRENKPVTAQSLTDALGSRVVKGVVQKTLEELLRERKLRAKDLKKTRIFFLNVDTYNENFFGPGNGKTQVDSLCPQRDASSDPSEEKKQGILNITKMARSVQDKARLFTQLQRSPTAMDRAERIQLALAEVNALNAQVSRAKETAQKSAAAYPTRHPPDGGIQYAVKRYQKARLLWKERKEYVERVVNEVLGDRYTATDLAEMFGIVTDAEAGVSFLQFAVQLPGSLASKH